MDKRKIIERMLIKWQKEHNKTQLTNKVKSISLEFTLKHSQLITTQFKDIEEESGSEAYHLEIVINGFVIVSIQSVFNGNLDSIGQENMLLEKMLELLIMNGLYIINDIDYAHHMFYKN